MSRSALDGGRLGGKLGAHDGRQLVNGAQLLVDETILRLPVTSQREQTADQSLTGRA